MATKFHNALSHISLNLCLKWKQVRDDPQTCQASNVSRYSETTIWIQLVKLLLTSLKVSLLLKKKKKKKGLESHFCLSLLFQFSEFTTHSFWKTHMHEWWIASHKALVDQKCKTVKSAFAGSRTRVYCLEGNYPNRWTTNARWCLRVSSILLLSLHILTVFPILPSSFFFFF